MPGQIIGGNYKVIDWLGRGGMAVVIRATHVTMGTDYAIKILAPDLISRESWLRFQSEARTMAGLTHSSFVRVYDLGLHNEVLPYYAMDLVSGHSLEAEIGEKGALPVADAVKIFLAVLDGLAYAHRNGIVHRDLKPSNIMICADSSAEAEQLQVKLLDFGIAKLSGKAGFAEQLLTQAGEIFGSPAYMSPEQTMGTPVDQRSDIYSIGCCIFETLTGYVPFDAELSLEVFMQHQSEEPPTLAEMAPERQFSESIEFLVARCLAKSPDDRYQSAKELAIDLQRIADRKDLTSYYRQEIASKREPIESGAMGFSATTRVAILAGSIAVIAFSAAIIFGMPTSLVESRLANEKSSETATVPGKRGSGKSALAGLELKIARPGFGKITFPSDSTPGVLYAGTSTLPVSYLLRGDVELPLEANYEFRPYTTDQNILEPLKSLKIGALVINEASIQECRSQYLGAPAGSQSASAVSSRPNIAPFFRRAGELFPIKKLKLSPSTIDYRDILFLLPQLDSITIARPESDQYLSEKDMEFLNPRLKSVGLIEIDDLEQQISKLTGAKHIKNLELASSSISPTVLAQVQAMPALNVLKVSTAKIADETLVSMLRLPCLRRLNLDYTADQLHIIEVARRKQKTLKSLMLYSFRSSPQLDARISALKRDGLSVQTFEKQIYGY